MLSVRKKSIGMGGPHDRTARRTGTGAPSIAGGARRGAPGHALWWLPPRRARIRCSRASTPPRWASCRSRSCRRWPAGCERWALGAALVSSERRALAHWAVYAGLAAMAWFGLAQQYRGPPQLTVLAGLGATLALQRGMG